MADRKPSHAISAEDSARIDRMRLRIAAVPFAAELLDVEDQIAQAPFFDAEMDAVGRCYLGTVTQKPVVALNPIYSDDKLVSFYAHELSHLRQSCLADDRQVTHPTVLCEALLMGIFVREADAYMRQSLFACEAFMHGDTGILSELMGMKVDDPVLANMARLVSSRLHGEEAQEFLNTHFWLTMGHLTGTPDLVQSYFGNAIDAMTNAIGRIGLMQQAHFQALDGLPREGGLEGAFDAMKDIGAFSPAGDGEEFNYLSPEDSKAFFGKLFALLPPDCQQRFTKTKETFVADFYTGMQKTALKKAAPMTKVKTAPRSFKK